MVKFKGMDYYKISNFVLKTTIPINYISEPLSVVYSECLLASFPSKKSGKALIFWRFPRCFPFIKVRTRVYQKTTVQSSYSSYFIKNCWIINVSYYQLSYYFNLNNLPSRYRIVRMVFRKPDPQHMWCKRS